MRSAARIVLVVAGVAVAAGVGYGKDDEAKEGEGERWTGDGISWVVPEGWTQQEGTGLRFATLVAGEGDQRVEIIVSRLGGNFGGVLANVNRWRMQVGLGPISEEELEEQGKKVKVGGEEAVVVDFTGEGEGAKRVVGAIIARAEQSWFVKLLAADDAVEPHREAFDRFVESIRFEGDEGV